MELHNIFCWTANEDHIHRDGAGRSSDYSLFHPHRISLQFTKSIVTYCFGSENIDVLISDQLN